jgi:hypothetical protein
MRKGNGFRQHWFQGLRKYPNFGVILSAAKNLSSLQVQCAERFFASLRMTPSTLFRSLWSLSGWNRIEQP